MKKLLVLTVFLFCAGCARAPDVSVTNVNTNAENVNATETANVNEVPTVNTNAAVTETVNMNTTTASPPEDTTQEENVAEETAVVADAEEATQEKEATEEESEEVRKISVDLQIVAPGSSTTYTVSVPEGSTVETIMEAATAKGLAYKTKGFTSLGTYVKTVNGLSEGDDMYWILYYNGSRATAGMTTQTVKKGDTIKWNYEHSF